jgi:hypothetical protein
MNMETDRYTDMFMRNMRMLTTMVTDISMITTIITMALMATLTSDPESIWVIFETIHPELGHLECSTCSKYPRTSPPQTA